MRRVLYLGYHFPPLGGAGVQRNVKFARYLPEFGYESVVVTGPGTAAERWTPVDGTMGAEVPDSTEVHRLPGPEPGEGSAWRARAERWLALEPGWARWWTREAVAAGRRAGPSTDLIYASLVPYESAEAAMQLARILGKPWVADLQDPWALDEMMIYPTGLHRARGRARMRRVLASADAVVMNTPESVQRVQRQFPELRAKPVVSIPNGFDGSDFAGPSPWRDDGKFRIVHTGYLHTDLGLRHRRTARVKRLVGGAVPGVDILTRSHVFLLEAIDRLIAAEPSLASTIEVHLAGVLSASDREVAARSPVVRLGGYLPHHETIALMRSADLLFLPMHNLPRGERTTIVPGKTYEYLASGRPILAAVPNGDARDLLGRSGTAFLCGPDDVTGIQRIVAMQLERVLRGDPEPLLDPDVLASFERRELTRTLAGVFDDLCDSRTGPRPALRVPELV